MYINTFKYNVNDQHSTLNSFTFNTIPLNYTLSSYSALNITCIELVIPSTKPAPPRLELEYSE